MIIMGMFGLVINQHNQEKNNNVNEDLT